MASAHEESHRTQHTGSIRAAVLGANDGIVSTASLIVGVAAAGTDGRGVLVAGIAGLVSGAMSMAAGEYVSVKSQEDTEQADLVLERRALSENWHGELEELAESYQDRGLSQELSQEVARQLMDHDALGAHARDEIGITQELSARPFQAAWWSAITFAAGAGIPVAMVPMLPLSTLTVAVPSVAMIALAVLGAIAARAGGARLLPASLRVCFWGALAMAATAVIGKLCAVT